MEEEHHHSKTHECETTVVAEEAAVETKDRGIFDFLGKKEEEKPQEEVIVTDFEKVTISEPEPKVEEEEEKKHGLLEKLHRSDSSSRSVSFYLISMFFFCFFPRLFTGLMEGRIK